MASTAIDTGKWFCWSNVFPAGWACKRGSKWSSLTLNVGPTIVGTSQDVRSHLVTCFSFCFLAGQCNSFPALPTLTLFLANFFFWHKCINVLVSNCFPLLTQILLLLRWLIHLSIKCCCIVVRQTNGIQCVRSVLVCNETRLSLIGCYHQHCIDTKTSDKQTQGCH